MQSADFKFLIDAGKSESEAELLEKEKKGD